MNKEELLRSIQEKMGDDFVSLRDLERPTSEFMMKYFIRFLNEYGVDTKKINEVSQNFYQEAFIDSTLYVLVYNAIRGVYPIPENLKNFSILSVIEPKVEDVHFIELMDNHHNFILKLMDEYLLPNKERYVDKTAYPQKNRLHKETLKRNRNDVAAMRGKLEPATLKVKEIRAQLEAEVLAESKKQQVLEPQWKSMETMRETERSLLNELQNEKDIRTRLEVANDEFAAHQSKLETLEDKIRETSSLVHKKLAYQEVLEEVLEEEKSSFVELTSVKDLKEHLLYEQSMLKQLDRQTALVEGKSKDISWQIELKQKSIAASEVVLAEEKGKHISNKIEANNIEQEKNDLETKEKKTNEDIGLVEIANLNLEKNSKLMDNTVAEMENAFVKNYEALQRKFFSRCNQIDQWLNEKIEQFT